MVNPVRTGEGSKIAEQPELLLDELGVPEDEELDDSPDELLLEDELLGADEDELDEELEGYELEELLLEDELLGGEDELDEEL